MFREINCGMETDENERKKERIFRREGKSFIFENENLRENREKKRKIL